MIRIRLQLIAAAAVLLAASAARADEAPPSVTAEMPGPAGLRAYAPANDDGRHIMLEWVAAEVEGLDEDREVVYLVYRTTAPEVPPLPLPPAKPEVGDWAGDWQLIGIATDTELKDDVTDDYAKEPPQVDQVWSLGASVPATDPETLDQSKTVPPATGGPRLYAVRAAIRTKDGLVAASPMLMAGPVSPKTAYFHTDKWFYFLVIVALAIALLYYYRTITKDPHSVFIRRIPGVDAIEEAVGRSTEMGRPVLYVTGTDDIQNIQTIASLLVLGRVAEMTAEYDTEIKVANLYPLTMVVAEEIVRQGFADAGRIDAHKPENVMFISSEQFAFAAGINGLILRDRPATNIYLGRYFAESLILAETGYVTGAVQIAGTAEIPQLPFFIAACDYTLIGEELYAVSAYLTREPGLLAMLKATDLVKLGLIIIIIVGAGLSIANAFNLGEVLIP